MLGFHIDMNTAHFTRSYLEKWLKELASLGYNTILWEPEAVVKWDNCPECSNSEAFSKAEFRKILDFAANLGLENIPLLQTLGHCEYVLKNEKYKKYAEKFDCIHQYCPQNQNFRNFIKTWIDEYIDLFKEVKFFHMGADETRYLGLCDQCHSYVKENSVSQLYVEFANDLSGHLLLKNITPIIWQDMILSHPETIEKLSKKIMMFDWMYDIQQGNGKIWVWTKGLLEGENIPKDTLDEFGKYIYPFGDEPGRTPETFYTADYLQDKGFKVVKCPASSSYGDSVFTPRHYFHLCNTYDSTQKGLSSNFCGSVLTSWTVHLFPYELQLSCIELPGYLCKNPEKSISDFWQHFVEKQFGLTDYNCLMKVFGLFSKACLFSSAPQLGYTKANFNTSKRYILDKLEDYSKSSLLEKHITFNKERLSEYKIGYELLNNLKVTVNKGHNLLEHWCLAAENLINRAEAGIYLLEAKFNIEKDVTRRDRILQEMAVLKVKTKKMYMDKIKPSNLDQYLHWIYDSIEYALLSEQLIKSKEECVLI